MKKTILAAVLATLLCGCVKQPPLNEHYTGMNNTKVEAVTFGLTIIPDLIGIAIDAAKEHKRNVAVKEAREAYISDLAEQVKAGKW